MLGYFKLYTLFVIISIVLILCRNDSDEIILEFKTMFNITRWLTCINIIFIYTILPLTIPYSVANFFSKWIK